MTAEVAIIGDRFMLSSMFREELEKACGREIRCTTMDLPWPDEPMHQAPHAPELEPVREYMGTPEQVLAHLGSAAALVTQLAPLPASVFERAQELRLVVVARGGPVNVDLDAAERHGVRVANAPGRNASAVAEFTIAAILVETRNITRGHDALRRGEYRSDLYRADTAGNELADLTVGIVGFGEIGRRVARLLRPFGCRIMAHDPYAVLDGGGADGASPASLDALLRESDIVTLHARATAETNDMIDARAIALMKPGSTLVNTARGSLVDYDALYEALRDGRIRSAMLETFPVEPVPPDSPLLALPNVTLTPHISGASIRTARNAAAMAAEEVRRWIRGEPALNPC